MLIYAADRAVDIQEAGKLGIEAEIRSIDFASIMERMRKGIKEVRTYCIGIRSQRALTI
jgi:pyruvate/2-oxoglutarate dehydrogenase complex dihydrolipoamide dehydrogenase (E3) component